MYGENIQTPYGKDPAGSFLCEPRASPCEANVLSLSSLYIFLPWVKCVTSNLTFKSIATFSKGLLDHFEGYMLFLL